MSWKRLLDERLAERHRTSREEIDALRAVVARNLNDARVEAVSADNRFGATYEAALTLATMAIAAAGYRIKGPAHHRTTLQSLPLVLPGKETSDDLTYFDRCRRLRNELSYEAADVVSTREVEDLIARTEAFRVRVDAFLASCSL